MIRTIACALSLLTLASARAAPPAAPARPNILWLVAEDIGPHLGCHGHPDAVTPRLDRLAAGSLRFLHAWSNAPVCAPARTTIITGCLANSLGAEHMRSEVKLPPAIRLFPALLRQAGYHCSNNAKEDYNVTRSERTWDQSSNKAHYRNRRPGQPFFAVFNLDATHEGKIRSDQGKPDHDPAQLHLPASHPDLPEVRTGWARYHDHITRMDHAVGILLDELAAQGLQDDTIVFFYGDNGPGMPRFKRFPGNAGLHVPLIVHVPEKWRHLAPHDYHPGGESKRLVSFVDLAPTVLSIAGLEAPPWMQGAAFMGLHPKPAPEFLFGFRGRMDERIDLARSATDGRFSYIRNFMPHLPWGQHVAYMFETPATRAWKDLFDQGKLPPAQASFWQPKAAEELHDLTMDPGETRNLAADPAHAGVLAKLRQAVRARILASRDPGLLPEAEMHRLARDTPVAIFANDPARYPVGEILRAAEIAADRKPQDLLEVRANLAHPHPGVRYWGATGLLIHGPEATRAAVPDLRKALDDESPSVAIAAAAALATAGSHRDAALATLRRYSDARRHGAYAATAALNALDSLGPAAGPLDDFLSTLPLDDPAAPPRARDYPRRLAGFLRTSRYSKQQNGR